MGVFVIDEVGGNPLVYLAQSHPSLHRAVDGEDDETGVGVGRLLVNEPVVSGLQDVQTGVEVNGDGGRLSGCFDVLLTRRKSVARIRTACSRPRRADFIDPVQWSEAAVETFGRHRVARGHASDARLADVP